MRVEVVTDVGLVRKNNEDAYLCDLDHGIFIVADGMGGHAAGEVASKMAVETVYQTMVASDSSDYAEIIREAFYQANHQIYQEAHKTELVGMGTTLTTAWVRGEKIYIGHVGDSRAYLIKNGQIQHLTNDHSFVGELIRIGEITEQEAMVHPQKNLLTRAMGSQSFVEVDVTEVEFMPGDRLILCTDGMSNLIDSQEIAKITGTEEDIKKAITTLLDLALERGGYDNITAIILENA